MKIFTSLLLALFAFAHVAFTQATFSLTPQNVSVVVADSTKDAEAINTIQNLQNVSKTIRWTRTVICIDPNNGLTQICDLVTCYFATVSTRTFTLAASASGPIITHFLKDAGVPGSAIIALHFENVANPADSVTSIYTFNACGVSGTAEQLPEANVQLFPNPVTEYFTLQNADAVANIRVYATDGRQVANFEATPGAQYPLTALTAGNYYVALLDQYQRVFQALQIEKR